MIKNKYFTELTKLLNQAYPTLASTHQLEFKKCFGAIAGYIDGQIFTTYGKFGMALRLPPETLERLFKVKGVKHLKYFTNGHIKKEYAIIPKHTMDNEQQFKELIDDSMNYVSSLLN